MSIPTTTAALTSEARDTLRVAAHGSVQLMTFAGVTGSPGRIATHGTLALHSATGLVGHVLAEKSGAKLAHKNGATLADQVLPALTGTMALLRATDPAEADNFRATVLLAVESATKAARNAPAAPMAAMARKITGALDAA